MPSVEGIFVVGHTLGAFGFLWGSTAAVAVADAVGGGVGGPRSMLVGLGLGGGASSTPCCVDD